MYSVPPVLSPHPEYSRAVQPSSRLSRGTPGYKELRVKSNKRKTRVNNCYARCISELTRKNELIREKVSGRKD
jgi:hypothetical protein